MTIRILSHGVPDKMVGLGRMSDYRGVRLERLHCIRIYIEFSIIIYGMVIYTGLHAFH